MKGLIVLIIAIMVFGVSTTGALSKELKIGFADKMKILFEYEKTKELNKELEKESQEAKLKVEEMSKEIRKLSDEMELLSVSAKKERRPEFETRVKKLNDFRRAKMQEIGRKQDDGIRKITAEIAEVCGRYGNKKGYDAIIDTRATLFPPDNDLTDDILKELNK